MVNQSKSFYHNYMRYQYYLGVGQFNHWPPFFHIVWGFMVILLNRYTIVLKLSLVFSWAIYCTMLIHFNYSSNKPINQLINLSCDQLSTWLIRSINRFTSTQQGRWFVTKEVMLLLLCIFVVRTVWEYVTGPSMHQMCNKTLLWCYSSFILQSPNQGI